MKIIYTCLLLILLIAPIYLYIHTFSIKKFKKDVYQLFIQAEQIYNSHGQGAEKMNYVIDMAWQLLPNPIRIFISPNLFRKIIEGWFTIIKDLLHYHIDETSMETDKKGAQ